METYDTVVVGGGPIGCFVAQHLASKGRYVAVFEEHPSIGTPLHCAGLVTQRIFDITHIPQTGIVQNTIYGAHIHSPSGEVMTIGGNKPYALVINRQRFDETIAKNALHAGAELKQDYKFSTAQQHRGCLTLSLQHEHQSHQVQCSLLVGADGPHSMVRKTFKFPHPLEMLQGIGAELTNTSLEPTFVHILVGHRISPGFFAWIIPTNHRGTTARIGLCINKQAASPLSYYFNILLNHPLLQGTTILQKFGGTIPLGPLKQTTTDHLLLVGDAAAQVKPTSGGGLYPGLLCATHCAHTIEHALQQQRYEKEALQSYHTNWMKDIGRELSLGMRFRTLFRAFTDAQLNKYLSKLNTRKTLDTINRYGDIDYPSRLAFPLLRTSPSLVSLVPSLLRRSKF
jgi:digeranylgeranylglycerophospholipid reductase